MAATSKPSMESERACRTVRGARELDSSPWYSRTMPREVSRSDRRKSMSTKSPSGVVHLSRA
eukprot:765259-Hanusia_phi.AAC.3